MQYRSIADMNAAIQAGMWRLPRDIDLVVGVPRSGLLAATLMSLTINAPLADLDGYCEGRVLAVGKTRRRAERVRAPGERRRVVVIDDSIFHGTAMREARRQVEEAGHGDDVTFVAVFGNGTDHKDADHVLEAVGQPRFFQWNVMHHAILADACMDIDGVLCHDPTADENDDGLNYERFLREARPLAIPTRPVGTLVTSRLEKYRALTEAWLKEWGVEYGKLVMLDLPDMETRRRSRAHGSYKGQVYARSRALLFVESEHHQSLEIVAASGKPVLCTCCFNLLRPGQHDPIALRQQVATLPRRFVLAKTPLTNVRSAKLLVRRLVGDTVIRIAKRSLSTDRTRSR
ncbi:phosphoribosyltransferase [Acuticoccus sp.]|uniref:phosphoribosyltransferase n=1 Tax=Acuticoccus sp. TaxID=1904378 RepID=UPI003B516EF1